MGKLPPTKLKVLPGLGLQVCKALEARYGVSESWHARMTPRLQSFVTALASANGLQFRSRQPALSPIVSVSCMLALIGRQAVAMTARPSKRTAV
jgi:hypothetical protein